MSNFRFLFLAALCALVGCNTPPATGNDAGGGGGTDAGTDGGGGGPVDAGNDAAAAACGTERPDLADTSGQEGLAIARDGTIYVSVSGGVGRITPDGDYDASWLGIDGAGTVWGMVLDADNTHLYVGSPSIGQVVTVSNLTTTPTYEMLVAIEAPNGLTLGPDGFLYVSDFANDDVVRVDTTDGTALSILSTAISAANGVAFTDEGTLLVDSYATGRVFELTLDSSHHESERATVAMGVGSPDGIAVDENGVLYVGDNAGRVLRMAADGTIDEVLLTGGSAVANLEWGTGPLNCHDLYVASGAGVERIELEVGQRVVPWH